jgi:hypothetical protein
MRSSPPIGGITRPAFGARTSDRAERSHPTNPTTLTTIAAASATASIARRRRHLDPGLFEPSLTAPPRRITLRHRALALRALARVRFFRAATSSA